MSKREMINPRVCVCVWGGGGGGVKNERRVCVTGNSGLLSCSEVGAWQDMTRRLAIFIINFGIKSPWINYVKYDGGCVVQITHIISMGEDVQYRTTKTAQCVAGSLIYLECRQLYYFHFIIL